MKATAFLFLFVLALTARPAEPLEPPMPPSPIAEFRKWLESPEERKIALARRSEASRQALQNKIAEYTALAPAERERRLKATEVQWYVSRLLKIPKAGRDAALRQVPVIWQPMVLERLITWDKMSPDLQKEALAHQLVMEYLSTPSDRKQAVLKSLSPSESAALKSRLEQWKVLPAVERARLDERLDEFFSMRPEKQQQTLNNFPESERKSMEKAVQAFKALSPQQRELCIKSFAEFAEKFAVMSRAEQIAFLKNAERWQEMSQKDRDMWRNVVAIAPPLPPLPEQTPPIPSTSTGTPPTP